MSKHIERSDKNCVTQPDGSCTGVGCMHDLPDDDTIIDRINEYRFKHGITWGGPPYSEEELAYARFSARENTHE